MGQAIHVSDLNYEGLNILNEPESIIASVTHPKVEKEVVVEEQLKEKKDEESAEPEVISKGKTEEKED